MLTFQKTHGRKRVSAGHNEEPIPQVSRQMEDSDSKPGDAAKRAPIYPLKTTSIKVAQNDISVQTENKVNNTHQKSFEF